MRTAPFVRCGTLPWVCLFALAVLVARLLGPTLAAAQPASSARPSLSASSAVQPPASAAPSGAPPAVVEPPPPPPAPPPPAPKAPSASASAPEPPPTPPTPSVSTPEPPAAPSAQINRAPAAAPVEVRLHDAVAFVIRTPYHGQSAEQRAQEATKALANAFVDASPDDVHVELTSDPDLGPASVAVVYVGKTPIVQLTQNDATAAGDASLSVHADGVAADLRKVIRAEKERSALASHVFSISLVVFFFVVMIYLLRRIGEFAERANAWVETHPDRIPAIRVRTLEVINPATLRSGLALTLSVGKWLAQFGIIYVWLIAALSLFDSTRGYTSRLTGFIIEPFASLASRLATTLPIAMVVVIALIAVAILLRVVGLFFESVAESATTLSWLPPDLARPTSLLARAGIIVVGLVFAAPLITGNAEGALPRVGLVAIVALGLSFVPLLTTSILGAVAVFGRRVPVGEYIEISGRIGKVLNVGLLDMSVEDDDGVEVRLPHLLWLLKPLRLLGALPRVSVRVTVDRSKANAALRDKLVVAIASAGEDPRVDIDTVAATSIDIVASVLTEDLDAKNRLFLLILGALEEGPDTLEQAP